ncbi:MAG: hypothetical protein IKT56_06045 [Clostridia bacterium]|nr:hypothetical protein [Clostridia bacterium]
MTVLDEVCFWVADIVPLLATLAAFIYGAKNFFKKGKAYYLQIVTMAMGCYAMGSFYHLCQTITTDEVIDGFTAAYLGRIGFFLFLFTANYGQMDGLLDDKTPALRKFRYIAFLAPVAVILLYIPCLLTEMPVSTKISLGLIWVAAAFSSYYNFKHSIMSDMCYGFVKAIRPYNICALVLTFLELILQVLWANYDIAFGFVLIAIVSVVFGAVSTVTMVMLKRGVEAWKI